MDRRGFLAGLFASVASVIAAPLAVASAREEPGSELTIDNLESLDLDYTRRHRRRRRRFSFRRRSRWHRRSRRRGYRITPQRAGKARPTAPARSRLRFD